MDQKPSDYVGHNLGGCGNETVEEGVAIHVPSVERKTIENHGGGCPEGGMGPKKGLVKMKGKG